ncbi:hypothetical protein DE146DRAFT_784479 [Phaeosphaeria sp. MPI-PUGE-AT-0046c]|nr:hypothetical protein DE146DRAFT_784479 [Phaeosphaeria sp. MPI-PUGE-AT-0046c]
MTTTLSPPTVEGTTGRRSRVSWGKKAIPLRNSNLFNKTKHSEEWHHIIDATAGVLHPSDPKFPYGFLRNHTDKYLKKKGKINQADADIRLAILVTAHTARDIAVAATAHAITAQSLRALLHADLNVMQGSYWGLKMWLQCLIAANEGNPASVTDMEAVWARKLLPFANQGPRAAEWYLAGVCLVLREMSISNMTVVPEFSILMRRAIGDFSRQLEGFRIHNRWAAAHDAVLWLMELATSTPVTTPPGHLLPEHILDSQLPIWRVWTHWKPDMDRLKRLARCSSERLAIVSDLVALEGPDMVTGAESTSREGLIAQYNEAKALLKWRGIIIEVPDRTRTQLKTTLMRVVGLLDIAIDESTPSHGSRFELFRDIIIARPIQASTLDLFVAACKIQWTPENDIYNAIREVYGNKGVLGGQHMLALQNLLCALHDTHAADLKNIFLQKWLRTGIETCLEECREAVRTQITKGLPWTKLAVEYHDFCTVLKASEHHWSSDLQSIKIHPSWPSSDDLRIVVQVYEAAQFHRQKRGRPDNSDSVTGQQVIGSGDCAAMSKHAAEKRSILEEVSEAYCIDHLLGGTTISHSYQRIVQNIILVWRQTSKPTIDEERRELAILVSESAGSDFILRCRYLAEIASGTEILEPGTSATELLTVVRQSERELSKAIIDLTNLLSSQKAWTSCWKDLLYSWLERQNDRITHAEPDILDYSLQVMTAAEWLSFIKRVEALFTDLTLAGSPNKTFPSILQPALLDWNKLVATYIGTIKRLETSIGEKCGAIQCLLSRHSEGQNLKVILFHLQQVEGRPTEHMLQKLVGRLLKDGSNAQNLKNCILDFVVATPHGLEICSQIWDAKIGQLKTPGLPPTSQQSVTRKALPASGNNSLQTTGDATENTSLTATNTSSYSVPPAVADVMVAGWLLNTDINERDSLAIASFAGFLGICVENISDSIWTLKIAEATKFWKKIEDEIMTEAMRLEGIQLALKAKDPKGTAVLLRELGIADNSLLDDEIASLPVSIANMVEKTGQDEVEISFGLNTLTELQRGAMGIPQGATTFSLRLSFDQDKSNSPGFCIHFNNEPGFDTIEHTPWLCSTDSTPPTEHVCTSTMTAFTWQLNRVIHGQLKIHNNGIASLHKLVTDRMQNMGQLCVTCGVSQRAPNVQLRRATPCNLMSCAQLWYQLPLHVRIPEIRSDTYAVDMLLTSVYAAAMSGRDRLLPGCPIHPAEAVKTILNSLPSMTVLSHAVNMSAVLRSHHKDAEKLISWACVHFRGYIATATGLCKVPNMPVGTHQFVLASASPGLEGDFVAKLPRPDSKTTVLFHGTSLDRLPAILAQGLRVCSGTSLQRTGAAHGKGIYMAEEPATSMSYSPAAISWRNSGLNNMRLLLGCEVVGEARSASKGIRLITDNNSVIVRYIFLLRSTATVPIANHLVPAMASSMVALRMGAV